MKIRLNSLSLCHKSVRFKTNNKISARKNCIYPNFTAITKPDEWLVDLGRQNQIVKYFIGQNGRYYPEYSYHVTKRPVIVSNKTNEQASEFTGEQLLPNREVGNMLSDLDNCTNEEKKRLVETFERTTGFFDFDKIKEKIDAEIVSSCCEMLYRHNFSKDDLKFIGYDSNCSLGRSLALPGSDADALFIIVDDTKSDNKWITAQMRWELKDIVNQRILSTPANHLPEVLSVSFLERGLKLADEAYKKADFSDVDLQRFEQNLYNSSKDFVKCAEFNIRLAELLPEDTQTRDEFYKTAMLAELIRNGKVLVNNLPNEISAKIKQSPLYKYSNLVRQEGLKYSQKYKYQKRRELQAKYQESDMNTKFEIVKELLKENYNLGSDEKNSLYSNTQQDGFDAMGNIDEMWHKIMHQVK